MSYRKLHLYRNKIEEAVKAFVNDGAEVVREDQSRKKVKFTIKFFDPTILPAMLFVDYNDDGTTTIEDSRGRNKEYAAALAEHVAKTTQVALYDADSLYFVSITDNQFEIFSDFMADCETTFTTTDVANGCKYTFCGEYGDTLYVTRYNNGAILFQGHPSITFNNAISILTDLYPSDVILVGLTKYYKIDFSREELESELMNICPNLVGKLTDDIVNAMLPSIGLRRIIPNGLSDYSYLCFPVLRGLEGIIKTIFKNKGVIMSAKSNFGGYLKFDEATQLASVEPVQAGLFPDATEKALVEKLYALLCQQRHRIFHFDPMTPIILSKEDAIDILQHTLKTINDAY